MNQKRARIDNNGFNHGLGTGITSNLTGFQWEPVLLSFHCRSISFEVLLADGTSKSYSIWGYLVS